MSEFEDFSLASHRFTTRNRRVVLLSLTTSSSLGLAASTIYVPSIPAIAHGLLTSITSVQLTFVGYLFAFALGMLVLGPLSDRFGRRRTLVSGMMLSAAASLVCAASPSIEMLIAGRVIQGIGACAGMVVGRALAREIWGREGAAQAIAVLGIAATLTQASAPVLGGYLQMWFGWRANFVVIAAFACLAAALIVRFVPNRGAAPVADATGQGMLANYRTLITGRRFVGYALAAAGAHAGFHIFAAGAPAVLIGKFGLTPQQYGYYAALPPLGFIVGSFLSSRLANRLGINAMIAIGATVLIPAGAVLLTLALLHVTGPFVIVGPMMFVCCGSGLVTPNATAGSLSANPGIAGSASGLVSTIQMAGAASATAALSLGPAGSPVVLALIIAGAGLFCATAFGSLAQSRPMTAEARVRVSV